MKILKKIKEFHWGYVLFSLFLLGLGIAFLLGRQQEESGADPLDVLATLVGVLTILYAAVFAFFTLRSTRNGIMLGFKMLFASVVLVVGILALIDKTTMVKIIVTALELLLLIDGAFKLNMSVRCCRYAVSGWWIMFLLSIPMIAIGFFLLRSTIEDDLSQRLLLLDGYRWLSILLCCEGVTNFAAAFLAGGYEKRVRQSYYEDFLAEQAAEAEEAAEENTENTAEENTENTTEEKTGKKGKKAKKKKASKNRKPEETLPVAADGEQTALDSVGEEETALADTEDAEATEATEDEPCEDALPLLPPSDSKKGE